MNAMPKNINILIVEDDKNLSFLTKEMLRKLGNNILEIFSSGESAVKYLESKRPDLILMDILLEGHIDGIDTAVIIKKKFGVPVVFITSYADNDMLERAKLTDPFGYLVKPFHMNDLKSTIEIALQKIGFENKLRERENWFRSTLNSIGNGIIATDQDDKIRFINKAAEKITGYAIEQNIGNPLEDIYKTYPDMTSEGLVYLISQGNADFKEMLKNNKILVSKEGNRIPIEENVSTIKYDDGNIVGKVISFKDVTLKREMQLSSITAKEFYLNIFEKFPVLIWRANKLGLFNYFNKYWLEFTGRQMDSEIYDRWYNGIHPDDRQSFINLFEKSLKSCEKFEIEIRLLASDKEYYYMICIGNPLYDLKGNFDGFIGVCLDISNRKALEDELRHAKTVSDSSSKAKTRFISNMSHEIRTPLNGIMGLTDILLDTKLSNEQFEYLTMIKQSSRILLDLLNNLLDFSKIEENKEVLHESKFNLYSVIQEILEPYQSVGKLNGVTISYEIDKDLQDDIIGDHRKIQRVLANLISNAFKFTQKGYIKLKVEMEKLPVSIGDELESLVIHFIVSDSGIGIPKEKHEVVFDSFSQVDGSLTKKYYGSGLGLAIAKRLVELMNGKIWFESTVGVGTTFHFVLELKKKTIYRESETLN